jgi:hypothetical protein
MTANQTKMPCNQMATRFFCLIGDPYGTKLEPFNGGFEASGKYFCRLD